MILYFVLFDASVVSYVTRLTCANQCWPRRWSSRLCPQLCLPRTCLRPCIIILCDLANCENVSVNVNNVYRPSLLIDDDSVCPGPDLTGGRPGAK